MNVAVGAVPLGVSLRSTGRATLLLLQREIAFHCVWRVVQTHRHRNTRMQFSFYGHPPSQRRSVPCVVLVMAKDFAVSFPVNRVPSNVLWKTSRGVSRVTSS